MNIERAMTTSDYDCGERRLELEWLAKEASRRRTIAEVGSWKGTTAIAMAENTSGHVYCVDTFRGSVGEEKHQKLDEGEEDWLYKTFIKNTSDFGNIHPVRMSSLDAAAHFRTINRKFDMVFLDASHDYESVKADILAWEPLLDGNGLLCGHDRSWEGVERALQDTIGRRAYVAAGAIWYRKL